LPNTSCVRSDNKIACHSLRGHGRRPALIADIRRKAGTSVLCHQWKRTQKKLFETPVDHSFNWNPHDNRYRVDADTNVQDPEYIQYPLHKVIAKNRKHGSARHSKQAQKALDKFEDLATGRGKDPFEGMYIGGAFDFENGDASDDAAVYDLEKLADTVAKSHAFHSSGMKKGPRGNRFSHAWGD